MSVVVVGAGVVGLSTALALAETGHPVSVWERNAAPGAEQSTHNSQVLHAGFNARPGSLKARLNVEGNRLLTERAPGWGVALRQTGTLVVAREPQGVRRLEELKHRGEANGVPGLEILSGREAREREPRLAEVAGALLAPTGGIIDAAGLVRALERECRARGVEIHYRRELRDAERRDHAWLLEDGSGPAEAADVVVNASGVRCAEVARRLGAGGFRIYPCLGEYARVEGGKREWLRSMVYGLPPPGYPGIGVHLTRTVDGGFLIGPTASYIDTEHPPPHPITTLTTFAEEAARFMPGLAPEDLVPVPPGVRAKPIPPGSSEPFGDFVIREDPPGSRAVQLIGIESPGLTSCLAIGRYVAREVVASLLPAP